MIDTFYVRHIKNLYNDSARTRFCLFVDYIFCLARFFVMYRELLVASVHQYKVESKSIRSAWLESKLKKERFELR